MIVDRREYRIKPGCMDDAVAWSKALRFAKPIRIQRSASGTFGILATEAEYESLAEYETLMAEWFARPEAGGLMAKWRELVDGHGQNEFWTVID